MNTPGDLIPLDPVTLAQLGRYDLVARMVVEGYMASLHCNVHHGTSIEFDHHAQYQPGDDLRRVDWRVWARSDRLYLKQYEGEPNMRVWLVLDASGSMQFRSTGLTKYQYAASLCASISHLAIRQHDRAGLVIAGSPAPIVLPARSDPRQLTRIDDRLAQTTRTGPTSLVDGLKTLAHHAPRRCLVMVVSDLLTPAEPVSNALAFFRHRKSDVAVLQVLDPAESEFSFTTAARFTDLETGAHIEGNPSRWRRAYRVAFDKYQREYHQQLKNLGIDLARFSTASSLETCLAHYLAQRARQRI
jgi:uncharacterized protein (DUF58 family)